MKKGPAGPSVFSESAEAQPGVLPTPLLKDIGIRFETKHGTA